MPHAERQRQRDAQAAAQFPVFLQHRSFGFVEVGQYAGAVLVEAAARIGEIQAARRAPQQLHAQAVLQ